ncbi:hypothetical protein EDC15_11956 [Acetobacter aceti NBRC 14818]|nr:hypothetical protein EDC15_11956 [Acetobacter aceti NBRC 14818]
MGVYPIAEAEVRFLSTVRLSLLSGPYPDFSEDNLSGKPVSGNRKTRGRAGTAQALRLASFLWISFYTFWQYRSYQQSVYGFGLTQMYPDNANDSLKRYYRKADPSEIFSQLLFKIHGSDDIRKDSRRFDLLVENLVSSVGFDEALNIMNQMLSDVYEMKKIVRKRPRYRRLPESEKVKGSSEDFFEKDELLSCLVLSGFGCRDIFSLVTRSEDVKGLVGSLEIVFGSLIVRKDEEEAVHRRDRLRAFDRLAEFVMKARNLYNYEQPAGGLIVENELTGEFGPSDVASVGAGSSK